MHWDLETLNLNGIHIRTIFFFESSDIHPLNDYALYYNQNNCKKWEQRTLQ